MTTQAATPKFTLCALAPEDKSVLDGYPGETGYGRRTRLLILLSCATVPWMAMAMAAAPFVA